MNIHYFGELVNKCRSLPISMIFMYGIKDDILNKFPDRLSWSS